MTSEFLLGISADTIAGWLGVAVALWSVIATTWQLFSTRQREALALTALGTALVLLARDRRALRRQIVVGD